MTSFSCRGMLALAAMLAISPVAAAPVRYSFATGPSSVSTVGAPVFDAGAFVSGEIDYDAEAPQTGPGNMPGTFVHLLASGGLSATVQGFGISDGLGSAVVGDDQTNTLPPGYDSADLLVLSAESPALPPDLAGFVLNGFRLVNVRLFWIEGLSGAPDFLSSPTLPAVLPSFAGRLALDFVPVTGGPTGFVFFEGLVARPLTVSTPEPGSLALLVVGLAVLAARRRPAS
jgi:hypothetical protein